MPVKIDFEPYREVILKMVTERKSAKQIADYLGVSNSTIWLVLKKWGCYHKRISLLALNDEQKTQLAEMYGKVPNNIIADKLGVCSATVIKYVKELGIPLKKSGNLVIQTYNPFLDNTDESNYWIGYIAGDGNLTKHKNQISIFTKDYEMVEKFNNFYTASTHVGNKTYRVSSGNTEIIYHLYFSNELVHKYLISVGVTPNKSKTLSFNIPLTPPIVRGLIDSDGWISPKECSIKVTTGSFDLVNQLQEFFSSYGIKSSICIKKGAFDVYVYNKENIQKIYYILYDNAQVFLNRKHDRFAALLKKFNIEKSCELLENPEMKLDEK